MGLDETSRAKLQSPKLQASNVPTSNVPGPNLPNLELRRLDDYQSWQVRWGGVSFLIDPWLTDDPIGGSFTRRHTSGFTTPEQLDGEAVTAILLCTGVSDHARPQTLAKFADVPVLGPRGAVRVARRAGCRAASVLRPGQQRQFDGPDGCGVLVRATRTGFPLGLIAVGYVIEAHDAAGIVRGRIWLDPHLPGVRQAQLIAPVDLALLPCHAVTAMVMPVTHGPTAAAAVATAAQAAVVVPTATDPGRDMTGWQRLMYRVNGGAAALRSLLTPGTELRPMEAGERLLIKHPAQ